MLTVTLRQEINDHLFTIVQDGCIVSRCDLLSAESIASELNDRNQPFLWVYPEDIVTERKYNA